MRTGLFDVLRERRTIAVTSAQAVVKLCTGEAWTSADWIMMSAVGMRQKR